MAILSPIRRLPIELLSMIFCHLMEGYYLRFPTSRPPFCDVMLVCRQWFNVFDTSCPSLWADILVNFRHPRSSILPRVLAATLSRSRQHPLSISVSYYDPDKSGPWWTKSTDFSGSTRIVGKPLMLKHAPNENASGLRAYEADHAAFGHCS
ncbi:hypothetical protein CPB85DRAFT_1303180 [Mucidula mucida]|nr:hypothetical protein CPB85DRAFT_1303180 [Mucidula mucida]